MTANIRSVNKPQRQTSASHDGLNSDNSFGALDLRVSAVSS